MRNAMKLGGLAIAMLLGLVAVAHAGSPAPTGGPGGKGYLDLISSNFQAATSGWMTTAQGYAFKIFTALAAMDLSWWGIKQVLKKNDLADFTAGATLKIASIAFFYTIVKYAPTWMPMITSSFMDMGQAIGGSAAASSTPSGVMAMAFSVVQQLYQVYDKAPGGMLHIGMNFFLAIIIAVTSLLALIGFGLVALQLLMTLVETYLVGGAGLVMLGFTGSGLTSSFGEKYIGYLVSVGIKLLMIYAIIGLGQSLINNELAYINNYIASNSGIPPTDLLTVGVSMLIYGVIGVQAPGLAASLMNGSPSMSLGNVAGGAAAIVGGAAAAGAAGLAGYAAGVGGLQKLADRVGMGAAGVAGAGAAGGGGAGVDRLAALSSATGAGSRPGAAGGISGAMPSAAGPGTGSTAGAALSPAVAREGQAAQALTQGKGRAESSGTPMGTGGEASSSSASDPATAPSVAPKGPVDALGDPAAQARGAPWASEAATERDKRRNPLDVLKDQTMSLIDKKDDIARHEGGGGGIQIRLSHHEGH
jgi:type IV secretion system protein TrbL